MDPFTLLAYSNAVFLYLELEYPTELDARCSDEYPWQSNERIARITMDCFMAEVTPQMCCSLIANEVRVHLEN